MLMHVFSTRLLHIFMIIVSGIFLSSTAISHANGIITPQVWSITPDISSTTHTDVAFVVRFNTAVSGVDRNDFVVTGHNTNQIINVRTLQDAAHYQVTVEHTQKAGTLLLTLVDNDTIVDENNMPLGGIGFSNGNAVSTAYTIDPPSIVLETPRLGLLSIGQRPSIALTSKDIPVISYYDATNKDLKLAICESPACLTPTIRTIDSADDVGQFSAIGLTKTGTPYIAYYDITNHNLKLAVCNNALCTKSKVSTIDNSANNVGQFVSMKLTLTGVPIISYYDATNTALKVLHCGSSTCKSPTITTLALTGMTDAGYANSLTLTRYHSGQSTLPDLPRISYYDRTNDNVRLVMCSTPQCTSASVFTVASTVSDVKFETTSIDVTSENIPIISYVDTNGDFSIATCTGLTQSGTACAGFNTVNVNTSLGDIEHTALKINQKDLPIIAMVDSAINTLYTNECGNAACTWSISHGPTIFDGDYPAIALNSVDLPITAYYDSANKALKISMESTTVDEGALPRFAKTAPSNNSTLAKPLAKLTWKAPIGATNHAYEYCIATSIAACTTWTNVGTATSVSVVVSVSTTYFWQVRVINPANTTESLGGYWSFRTK